MFGECEIGKDAFLEDGLVLFGGGKEVGDGGEEDTGSFAK